MQGTEPGLPFPHHQVNYLWRMRRILLLTALLTTLFACKKSTIAGDDCAGNCYIITGTLLDTPFQRPVAGARVTLNHLTNPANGTWIGIRTATTDEAGTYTLRYDLSAAPNGGTFMVIPYKIGYLDNAVHAGLSQTFGLAPAQANNPVRHDITMYRAAYLKVRLTASALTPFAPLSFRAHYLNHPLVSPMQTTRILDPQFTSVLDTTLHWTTGGNVRTFLEVSGQRTYRDTVIVPADSVREWHIAL